MVNSYVWVCYCILLICNMLEWNGMQYAIAYGKNFYDLEWVYNMQFAQLEWYLALEDLLRISLLPSQIYFYAL